jgi:hypothetical protein
MDWMKLCSCRGLFKDSEKQKKQKVVNRERRGGGYILCHNTTVNMQHSYSQVFLYT